MDTPGGAAVRRWAELTWTEVAALDRARMAALLPVGATEAHGPHLPLATDVVIAEAMAEAAAHRLAGRGWHPLLLPSFAYTAAPFAAGFPGTLPVRPETVMSLLADVAAALAGCGVPVLALANSHLDPAHLRALHGAADAIRREGRIAVAFPDLTRKPWALRLTPEFKSGACHAGQFEGSVVLAAAPHLVREEVRRRLPRNPASISQAIRAGKSTFAAAGGPEAYFGDPAAATAEEGRETIEVLGAILEEAVLAELTPPPPGS